MTMLEKWINDYIKDLNLENIEWINLNAKELYEFFRKNYLDLRFGYIYDKNEKTLYATPLGMYYINFDSPINQNKFNFLLGVVPNNINKKTIVCALTYLNNYIIYSNQKIPLTYFATVEVNSYFRNKGLYKQMCNIVYNYINVNHPILLSRISEMGKEYKVYELLKDTLRSKGFNQFIIEDNNRFDENFYNYICQNQKVLKK